MVSLFIGCGASEDGQDRTLDIDSINVAQEKLLRVGETNFQVVEEILPKDIRDEGNKNGEN
jgi:hypothetical protein